MPSKTRKKKKQNNIALGILFSAAIIFLIVISLFGKAVTLFQKGKYDNSYPFSIKIKSSNKVQFVYFYPKENKVSLLDLDAGKDTSDSQIPQDTQIVVPGGVSSSNLKNFFNKFVEDKHIKTELTSIDRARIYLLIKSINDNDIKMQSLASLSDPNAQKVITDIFSDPQILAEDLRIEVVNATGIYGVGNKAAQLFTNMGANVIFVKTADETEKKSVIYYSDKKSYTVSRLEKLLGFTSSKNTKSSISDILVVIGQDDNFLINN